MSRSGSYRSSFWVPLQLPRLRRGRRSRCKATAGRTRAKTAIENRIVSPYIPGFGARDWTARTGLLPSMLELCVIQQMQGTVSLYTQDRSYGELRASLPREQRAQRNEQNQRRPAHLVNRMDCSRYRCRTSTDECSTRSTEIRSRAFESHTNFVHAKRHERR